MVEGLTRPDPTLRFDDQRVTGSSGGPVSRATPTVNVTCSPPECSSSSVWGIVDFDVGGRTEPCGWRPLGEVTCGVAWEGPVETPAVVRAILARDSAPAPPDRWWHAEADVTLVDGSAPAFSLVAAPAPASSTTLTIAPATGVTVDDVAIAVQPGAVPPISYVAWGGNWRDVSPEGALAVSIPTVAGMLVRVIAWGSAEGGANSNASWSGPPPGATLALPLDLPPELGEPADGASDVSPGTTLSWTPADGFVYRLRLTGEGLPGLEIVTARTTITLPDLSALGFALRSGATYSWWIGATGPLAGADEAARGFALRPGLSQYLESGFRRLTIR